MDPTPKPSSAEILLPQMAWIRALAQRLVRDPAQADDLVQETCVVALERRPADERRTRRWLATIMRNLVRQRVRGDGRRSEREEVGARRGETPSTAELVEQVSVQREIAARVLDLDEPYRTTVLLRYFQDMPPRKIAERLGVPVTTVQSRLKRAHEKLRLSLDRSYGDRRAWSALVLPFAFEADSLTGPALGSLLMKLKIVVAATLVAATGTVVAISQWDGDAAELAEPSAQLVTPQAVPAPAEPLVQRYGDAVAQPGGRRELEVPGEAPAEVAATTPAATPLLRAEGRVLDGDGQGVAGVPLVFVDGSQNEEDVVGTSGAGGRFTFQTTRGTGALAVGDSRWVTVREGAWSEDSSYDPVVVIAPAVDLGGRVVDELGRPLEAAALRLRLPENFGSRFETILDATNQLSWTATTDSDGSFLLEDVPAIGGSTLRAVLDGYSAAAIEPPRHDDRALTLILQLPTAPVEGVVRGRVVDAEGNAVQEARVGLGLASVLTNETGDFEIALARAVTSDTLTAIKAGFLPSSMERPMQPETMDDGTLSTGWPDSVVLRLGEPTRSIGGLVVDHEGKPRSGLKVWVADTTPFAPLGMMPSRLEPLLAGVTIPEEALESELMLPPTDGNNYNDWTATAGPPSPIWYWVRTDGDGRFDMPGLTHRSYRLSVLDEATTVIHTSDPIPAGAQEAVIELPKPRLIERFYGRVVDDRGRPVPDVSVLYRASVADVQGRVFGGQSRVTLQQKGPRARSDDDGRFVLQDVPKGSVYLTLKADSIVPTGWTMGENDDPRDCKIVVRTRLHVSVELTEDLDRADLVAVVDEEGGPLDVMVLSRGSTSAYTDMPLVNGRTGVFVVSSAARTLYLIKNDEVIEEVPLDLISGEVNTLRL